MVTSADYHNAGEADGAGLEAEVEGGGGRRGLSDQI